MSISSIEQLKQHFNLTSQELNWKEEKSSVPLKITDYYLSLIDKTDVNDPLRKQVVPTCQENTVTALESPDPLAEVSHSPSERLIHRYSNRVAFLVTDLCAQYCRHCFRRRFTGNMMGKANREDLDFVCGYLQKHKEVKEMLLTGGDPLTLTDSELDEVITLIRSASPHLIIRICTRFPVVEPARITDNLISIFKKHNTAPFYLMTQFNHPRELTEQAVKAVAGFVDAGIPAMNQSVLLRGVNDNADTLEELCNNLLFARIKPYYLFQGDLVAGTSAFRVPLKEGLKIEKELRKRLSGLAMPNYTSDLPDGGGKIPLCGSYIAGYENGIWKLANLDGQIREYPDPESV